MTEKETSGQTAGINYAPECEDCHETLISGEVRLCQDCYFKRADRYPNLLRERNEARAAVGRYTSQALPGGTRVVPDLRNREVDDALESAAKLGLRVTVSGPAKGRVIAQSPAPGTVVGSGSTVVLQSQ